MGRARKQVAESFQHGSGPNAVVSNLEYEWGNDGYAFWYKLQELLCRSDGHYYDCNSPGNMETLAFLTHLEPKKTVEILDKLAKLNEIDRDLWKKGRVIWCQSLVDSLQRTYSKRANSLPTKPDLSLFGSEEEPQKQERKKKEKREKKPAEAKEEKVEYGEFVHMTAEEKEKLEQEFGFKETAIAITILDNYKGSTGRTYKSDYRAIRSWAMDRAKETIEKNGGKTDAGAGKNKFRASTGFGGGLMRDIERSESARSED